MEPTQLTDPIVGTPKGDAVDAGDVEVSLESTPVKPQEKSVSPAKTVEKPASDEPSPKERWLENQLAAQRRVMEKLERTVSALGQRVTVPAATSTPPASGREALPAGTPVSTVARYDAMVEAGDWQGAVGLIAEERVQRALEQRDQQAAQQLEESQRSQAAQKHLLLLASNKARVITRYPSLDQDQGDPTSAEAKLYDEAYKQVEQESPELLQYPTAPELVMYRMEDLARQRGVALTARNGNGGSPLPAAPRRGSTPPPRATGGGRTTTLSSEERQFCDFNGVKYEDYAKNRVALTTEGTVHT